MVEEAGDYEIDVLSRSKYAGDIIHRLYDESMQNDPKLKDIDSRINGFDRIKSDSIEKYLDYISKNENYWQTSEKYISSISDSLIRENTRSIFSLMKKNYLTSIDGHEKVVQSINHSKKELRDQALVLKLMVTKSMIINFQKNELIDIASLEEIAFQLQQLINETKEYSNSLK